MENKNYLSNEYNISDVNATEESFIQYKTRQSALITKVYMWMALALIITGITAYMVASSQVLLSMIIANRIVFYGLLIGEILLVVFLSSRINRMSYSLAIAVFLLYSFINGLTLSVLFLIYTGASIVSCFLITAGTFGVMSLYGYYTKKDLTKLGNLCMMALVGIIIATVVNIFLKNPMASLIISYIGVLVFIGLIAYDTQKIKRLAQTEISEEESKKISILGALTLYLDFVNLFLYILRIMGNRR